jgi:hypothetical protein
LADTPCMSQNTIPSSPHLTQALAQLTQLAPQSELAKAGVDVLVKNMSGNQVNLANITTGQNITLAKSDLNATLTNRQVYNVKVISRGLSTVLQFAAHNTVPPVSAPLNEKQLATLAKLPANPLPGNTVSPGLLNFKGRISANKNNQLTLTIIGSQPKQNLTLDMPHAQKFAIGSHINVELKPVAKNGHVTVTQMPVQPLLHSQHEITINKSNVASLSALLQALNIPLNKAAVRHLAAMLTTAGQGALPGNTKKQDSHVMPLTTAIENATGRTQHKDEIIQAPQMTNNVKGQALDVLHSLLRVVQARAELPSDSLSRILGALADPQLAIEPSIKQLSEQLGQQVKQGLAQGKEQDASQIRQLLTQPTLSLNPQQILSPIPGQGLLGGLLALVQMSLASRLARSQPNQTQHLADALSPLTTTEPPTAAKATGGVSAKGLSVFAQIEQKHQLLKELSRLFAGHQTSKLGNAEQLLQGQDTFHYTLPSAFGDKLRDIELLVRREQQHSARKTPGDEPKNRQWHLTMKLSVGEQGELLTKAKLNQDNLEIDFYTSNETTREQVLNFLPLLKKRLTGLGIDMAKSTCQLGKIPSSLQQKAYHLLQTKV